MRKDPTEFRERFKKWQSGEKVYEAGLPKYEDGGELVNGGELPEVVVNGYAPLRLTTYYIGSSRYPLTGHSKLDIPIDRKTWNDYVIEDPNTIISDRVSPYMTIDKSSNAKDYNLLTNNCADATLGYLNKAFGTNESTFLFTTPGDVRDYALNKLKGKLIKNSDGSDTVLIPRSSKNAKKLSVTALDMFKDDLSGTARIDYKGPFSYTKNHTKNLSKYLDGKEPYLYSGYNYEYKTPTKNGAKLSIKDGRLYSGNKIVSAGYEWYDGNNGNTYRTIGGGKFKLISTQEGPVKRSSTRRGDNAHYIYKSENDDETVDYLREMDKDELGMNDKLYLYRNKFVNNRLATEENYAIPQHLPGVKRRTLSTGPYKGVRVYDNTLDSLYSNSVKNNFPFESTLGLAAETSLGKDRHMSMNETKKDYHLAKKFPYYNAAQNGRYVLFPSDMMNNHNYYVGNNATGVVNTLIRNKRISGTESWKNDGNIWPTIGGKNGLTQDERKILDEEGKKALTWKENSSNNPYENAFDFYKKYNYGMGPSYPDTTSLRGLQILNTPEIKAWKDERNLQEPMIYRPEDYKIIPNWNLLTTYRQ